MRTLTIQSISKVRDDIIDITNGKVDGKPACRITFEKPLTTEEITKFMKWKSVVAVGTAHYRYAPEIRHGYIVVKGGM